MTATFWLEKDTAFWLQRESEEGGGILTLGSELTVYGRWNDFEALGRRLLDGVAQLRQIDKVVAGEVGEG